MGPLIPNDPDQRPAFAQLFILDDDDAHKHCVGFERDTDRGLDPELLRELHAMLASNKRYIPVFRTAHDIMRQELEDHGQPLANVCLVITEDGRADVRRYNRPTAPKNLDKTTVKSLSKWLVMMRMRMRMLWRLIVMMSMLMADVAEVEDAVAVEQAVAVAEVQQAVAVVQAVAVAKVQAVAEVQEAVDVEQAVAEVQAVRVQVQQPMAEVQGQDLLQMKEWSKIPQPRITSRLEIGLLSYSIPDVPPLCPSMM
eukprot:gene13349-19191_t